MPEVVNELDEAIATLKGNSGYTAYAIFNQDGIVLKYEGMDYKSAVKHSYLTLDLHMMSKRCIKECMEAPDNELESIRLKTDEYEMIVAQHGGNTLVVMQDTRPVAVEEEEAAAE